MTPARGSVAGTHLPCPVVSCASSPTPMAVVLAPSRVRENARTTVDRRPCERVGHLEWHLPVSGHLRQRCSRIVCKHSSPCPPSRCDATRPAQIPCNVQAHNRTGTEPTVTAGGGSESLPPPACQAHRGHRDLRAEVRVRHSSFPLRSSSALPDMATRSPPQYCIPIKLTSGIRYV